MKRSTITIAIARMIVVFINDGFGSIILRLINSNVSGEVFSDVMLGKTFAAIEITTNQRLCFEAYLSYLLPQYKIRRLYVPVKSVRKSSLVQSDTWICFR